MMTAPETWPHRLDRTLVIAAAPATVFRFFTDSMRWATWWGAGSTIEARPGGRLRIRHPDGVVVSGEVLDVEAPHHIVFTYGHEQGIPIALGGSRVTIRLEPIGNTTRLHLAHEFAEVDARDHHIQGWRYQLSVFGNVVADEIFAGVGSAVDAWFEAWSDRDAAARDATLAHLTSPHVRFRDKFSVIEGAADLAAQIAAYHQFMPGLRIARDGDIQHCQGTVLANWIARTVDGTERGRGMSVFTFNAHNQIESVIGFWLSSEPNRRRLA
jgi:uncharacterized protein YndB with AHSA1/START domain